MDFVPERDFESLQRAVKRLAQRGIPHVEAQRLSGIPIGEGKVPPQSRRRYAASQRRQIPVVVSVGDLQLSVCSVI